MSYTTTTTFYSSSYLNNFFLFVRAYKTYVHILKIVCEIHLNISCLFYRPHSTLAIFTLAIYNLFSRKHKIWWWWCTYNNKNAQILFNCMYDTADITFYLQIITTQIKIYKSFMRELLSSSLFYTHNHNHSSLIFLNFKMYNIIYVCSGVVCCVVPYRCRVCSVCIDKYGCF